MRDLTQTIEQSKIVARENPKTPPSKWVPIHVWYCVGCDAYYASSTIHDIDLSKLSGGKIRTTVGTMELATRDICGICGVRRIPVACRIVVPIPQESIIKFD